jgi:hypothetical protein
LTVVPGSIVGFDNKLAEKSEPIYDGLKQSLRKTQFIHADETGWKRDWLWIFTNPDIAFFHIDESRGSKVVIDHLGEFYNGVLITDFWNAYRSKVGAFAKQKCLAHLLRDIRELLKDEKLDQVAKAFLESVKDLLQDAIRLHNAASTLSNDEYRSMKKNILKRFNELLANPELKHHEADNIRKRLIAFKDELFVFLKFPAILPTNHAAAYCTSCVMLYVFNITRDLYIPKRTKNLGILRLLDFIQKGFVRRLKQKLLTNTIFINFKQACVLPFFQLI